MSTALLLTSKMTDEFKEVDTEGFAYHQTHLDDEYGYYEQQLKHDYRKNNNSGDITPRYNNYKDWSNTNLSKDVERTVNLIPEGNEITVKDLRAALTSTFAMSKDYANKVIKEVGSNDVRINARNNSYDKSIDEIRLKKI